MYSFERQVWAMGYRRVVGLDEAGRGPLAGPVAAGAVILPREIYLPGLDDSKRVPEKRREELYKIIRERALAVGVGMVDPEGIDEENILWASYLAMERALEDLKMSPDYLLVDAIRLPSVSAPQTPIIGGDALSASIAAASIVAKVTRDRYMVEMDQLYPEYGFAANKGYGTPEHRQALERYGPCRIHRLSFAPVREAARTRGEMAGA
jgi:ribonuclease HII